MVSASEDTTVYNLQLGDGITGPAQDAAKALNQLQQQMTADRSALKAMDKEMKALQKSSVVNIETYRGLQSAIDAKRASLTKSQEAFNKLGSGQLKAQVKAIGLRDSLREVSTTAQAIPPSLGGPIDRLAKIAQVASGAVSATIALRVAFVGLIAVAGFLTAKLFGLAAASADARQQEALHLQTLSKFRVGADGVAGLQSVIDSVSESVSIGREQVVEYAGALAKSGLQGAALENALRGASITASALGKQAGERFVGMAKAVRGSDEAVSRLASNAKTKLGGVVQQQMLTMEVRQKKAKEGFASIFAGLKTERLAKAGKALEDTFKQSTASGRTLKTLMGVLVQPLMDGVARAKEIFKTFWLQMLIGVAELTIAYLTIRNWFRRTFAGPEVEGPLTKLFSLFQAGRVFVYVLVAAFAALAVSVIAATWPVLLAVGAFALLLNTLSLLHDLWKEIDWGSMGRSIIEGLVGGVKEAWESLKAGFTIIANDAAQLFKNALGIASPSKVFVELGTEIPAGLEQGVQQGTPRAQRAVSDLVAVPKLQDTSGAAGGGERGATNIGGNVSLTINALHIHSPSGEPADHAREFRRELESVLEGLALEVGLTPAGA